MKTKTAVIRMYDGSVYISNPKEYINADSIAEDMNKARPGMMVAIENIVVPYENIRSVSVDYAASIWQVIDTDGLVVCVDGLLTDPEHADDEVHFVSDQTDEDIMDEILAMKEEDNESV